jgi:hypothetical protein
MSVPAPRPARGEGRVRHLRLVPTVFDGGGGGGDEPRETWRAEIVRLARSNPAVYRFVREAAVTRTQLGALQDALGVDSGEAR